MIDERIIKRQIQCALPKTISYFENGKMHELKRRLKFDEYGVTAHYTGRIINSRAARLLYYSVQKEYILFEDGKNIRMDLNLILFRPDGFSITYRPTR